MMHLTLAFNELHSEAAKLLANAVSMEVTMRDGGRALEVAAGLPLGLP
jgi:hypothetical protein